MSVSSVVRSRRTASVLIRCPTVSVAAPRAAPHLLASITALLVVIVGLTGFGMYARGQEAREARAFAPFLLPQKNVGLALQTAQLHRSDLLPMYGSSELQHGGDWNARNFFRSQPTGFQVSGVGNGGDGPLMYLQMLGALGANLRGQKLVVILTPDAFLQDELASDYFAGNFSALQAYGLLYNPRLSPALRRDAARRLLDYRPTLEQAPLLLFGARQLAADTPTSRALYVAALPLGVARLAILRLQDHWATLVELRSHEPVGATPAQPTTPDWASLDHTARAQRSVRAGDNPYGFSATYWRENRKALAALAGSWSDARFHARLESSATWTDLELLLRATRELGAQPLVLTTPLPGALYADMGVSPRARTEFYTRLQALCDRYGVAVRDYQDHELDTGFVDDRTAHPSEVAWLAFDHDLDGFVHGRLH
jgi:D-alanine transfer protein